MVYYLALERCDGHRERFGRMKGSQVAECEIDGVNGEFSIDKVYLLFRSGKNIKIKINNDKYWVRIMNRKDDKNWTQITNRKDE